MKRPLTFEERRRADFLLAFAQEAAMALAAREPDPIEDEERAAHFGVPARAEKDRR